LYERAIDFVNYSIGRDVGKADRKIEE
jgi:hypothetical protein